MSASMTMRVCTGAAAGTESDAQTGFALMDIDSALNEPVANQVAPGSNSFEKWLRLRLDTADGQSVSGFWIERNGDLPDGVVIKIGRTDTGVTPTASTSTVATETMHDGRRYYFDGASYESDGDGTSYVVLQEQVTADADTGAIDTQVFEWGWQTASA